MEKARLMPIKIKKIKQVDNPTNEDLIFVSTIHALSAIGNKTIQYYNINNYFDLLEVNNDIIEGRFSGAYTAKPVIIGMLNTMRRKIKELRKFPENRAKYERFYTQIFEARNAEK